MVTFVGEKLQVSSFKLQATSFKLLKLWVFKSEVAEAFAFLRLAACSLQLAAIYNQIIIQYARDQLYQGEPARCDRTSCDEEFQGDPPCGRNP
jgi:hypothetical protein